MKPVFLSVLLACLAGCGVAVRPHTERVVLIGDSITYLWRTSDQQPFQQRMWIDKGVTGQNSTQIALRFERDVLAQFPDVVHILAGTNDVYAGWSLCSNPPGHATLTNPPTSASWKYPVDTCTNIQYMVASAKREHIRVILGTIPPWGPGALSAEFDPSPERFFRIAQLNQWLKDYAVTEQIELVDYHSLLADTNGNNYAAAYTGDGVHPTPAGYAVMTSAAVPALDP